MAKFIVLKARMARGATETNKDDESQGERKRGWMDGRMGEGQGGKQGGKGSKQGRKAGRKDGCMLDGWMDG